MTRFRTIFACSAVLLLLLTGCGLTKGSIRSEREADAHHKLGIAYLNENNLQMAFVEFSKAAEFKPDEKTYHYALGHVYFRMDKFDDAVREYSKALAIDPMYGDAHNALGAVYGKMELWDEAASEYQKALNNPEYSTPQGARYNLGIAYFKKDDFQSALIEFKEAIRIQHETAMFHLWLGHTYMKLNMTREAISAYEEARKLDQNSVDVWLNLGLAYYKEGNRAEALAAFKKVVGISPNSTAAAEAMRYIEMFNRQ